MTRRDFEEEEEFQSSISHKDRKQPDIIMKMLQKNREDLDDKVVLFTQLLRHEI